MNAKANEIIKKMKKMSINKIWLLKSVAGQLSHRLKIRLGRKSSELHSVSLPCMCSV